MPEVKNEYASLENYVFVYSLVLSLLRFIQSVVHGVCFSFWTPRSGALAGRSSELRAYRAELKYLKSLGPLPASTRKLKVTSTLIKRLGGGRMLISSYGLEYKTTFPAKLRCVKELEYVDSSSSRNLYLEKGSWLLFGNLAYWVAGARDYYEDLCYKPESEVLLELRDTLRSKVKRATDDHRSTDLNLRFHS